MTTHVTLHDLVTHRTIATQPFFSDLRSVGDAWRWVATTTAEEFECCAEDVHCTDDDVITADGVPVARLTIAVVGDSVTLVGRDGHDHPHRTN